MLLLPSFWSAALVIITLLLIDLSIIGFMYYWSLPLNMLTMVNLVISIGELGLSELFDHADRGLVCPTQLATASERVTFRRSAIRRQNLPQKARPAPAPCCSTKKDHDAVWFAVGPCPRCPQCD